MLINKSNIINVRNMNKYKTKTSTSQLDGDMLKNVPSYQNEHFLYYKFLILKKKLVINTNIQHKHPHTLTHRNNLNTRINAMMLN